MNELDSTRRIMSRTELSARLNHYLLELTSLSPQNKITKISAMELLSPKRLDLMAKYLYAKFYLQNIKSGWPIEQYRDHLRVFNNFKEHDHSGKKSFEDFVEAFNEVIESIRVDKFSAEKSILPISREGVLIDGAHRLAAAIALNLKVDIAEIDIEPQAYDFRYFRRVGLSQNHIESLVLEYVRLAKDVKVAVVFPVAAGRDSDIETMIEAQSKILYSKRIKLTYTGRTNFVRTLYAEENWIRNGSKDSSALAAAVAGRFGKADHVYLVYFVQSNLNIARTYKETVRSWFDLGNFPMHISDYHIETLKVAEITLNENGIEWLNYSRNQRFPVFDNLFREFRDQLDSAAIDSLVLDGSSTLTAFGLRDVNDIDYLGVKVFENLVGAASHDEELIYHPKSKEELVLDPANYFWFEGIKLISIRNLREMKASRGEAKDKADVLLIDGIFDNKNKLSHNLTHLANRSVSTLVMLKTRMTRMIALMLPKPVKKLILRAFDIPFFLSQKFGPSDRTMDYRGFTLHYPKGASLIKRIQHGRLYEPKVASALVNHLSIDRDGLFLDIGANIGLMTLNVLSKLPGTRVVAFEPGPAQLEYLKNTLRSNSLEALVTIESRALSNKTGIAQFAAHGDVHSSGDGFCDTRRAGSSNQIQVQTYTLDEWWEESGKPDISIIKIDTEGAELWILQGASAVIAKNKPVIILEIQETNLEAYPHTEKDMLQYFESIGYRLETLAGADVDEQTLVEQMRIDENFVGHPR